MAVKKRINLALQGGGAHGAFTWGVLDRLLQEPELDIAGISGTSAGALNGAAVKAALSKGGTSEDARENLSWLWQQIGAIDEPSLQPWLSLVPPGIISRSIEYSPVYMMGERFGQLVSPYENPLGAVNPLERVVAKFDFENVCSDNGPKLHICATNVRSGKIRVFTGEEISVQSILASACLPTLFRAVEIYDPASERVEAYWDGGYTGNPALFPLFDPALPDDIVVVNINPLHREDVPNTGREIQNRINEISFNASLLRELRAINFVKRLLASGDLKPGSMKDVNLHMIADDDLMTRLSVATKSVPNPAVIAQLKSAGREVANIFLEHHFDDVNRHSTVNLPDFFD